MLKKPITFNTQVHFYFPSLKQPLVLDSILAAHNYDFFFIFLLFSKAKNKKKLRIWDRTNCQAVNFAILYCSFFFIPIHFTIFFYFFQYIFMPKNKKHTIWNRTNCRPVNLSILSCYLLFSFYFLIFSWFSFYFLIVLCQGTKT